VTLYAWLGVLVAVAFVGPGGAVPAVATALFVLTVLFVAAMGTVQSGAVVLTTAILLGPWLTPRVFGGAQVSGLNISTLAALTGLGTYVLRFRGRRLPKSPSVQRMVLVGVLLMLWDGTVSLRGHGWSPGIMGGYLRLICVVLWGYRAGTHSRNLDQTLFAGTLYSLGPVALGISILFSVATSSYSSVSDVAVARSSGLFDPNFVALALLTALVFPVAVVTFTKTLPQHRLFAVGLAVFGLACVVATGSRTALLTLGVATVLWSWAIGLKRGGLALVAMGTLSLGAWGVMNASFHERYMSLGSGLRGGRLPAWTNALDAWLSSPIAGVGRAQYYGTYGTGDAGAHNALLTFLAEGGLISGGLWLLLLALLARRALVLRNRRLFITGTVLLTITVVYFVGSNGIGMSLVDPCTVLFAALAAMLMGYAERRAARPAVPVTATGGILSVTLWGLILILPWQSGEAMPASGHLGPDRGILSITKEAEDFDDNEVWAPGVPTGLRVPYEGRRLIAAT
jgi:O-antigen ligase